MTMSRLAVTPLMVLAFGAAGGHAQQAPDLNGIERNEPAQTERGRIELGLPLACEPHRTCFIQSYTDVDSSPAVKDYACGSATYDKHDGTDFRLLSAAAAKDGVPVLAAAPGRIRATRDGMADVFVREAKPEDIKNRECGNGVVIDHGNGWETQYCHLKKGSISVSKGQTVARGDKLGFVGYSGMAEFAHVHLTVRQGARALDPFAPDAAEGTCAAPAAGNRDGSATLWQPAVAAQLRYLNGEIIGAGFTSVAPEFQKLEADHRAIAPLEPTSPALLFYARFINLVAGDRVRIVVNGPGGTLVEQLSEPLERNKATYISYAGKKRRDVPWQQGRYEARAEIVREGAVTAASVTTFDMPAAPAKP